MLCRSRAGFALCSWLLVVGGCTERGSSDQESRPLPTPEPPASATASSPRLEAPKGAKKPAAAVEGAKEPSKPKLPAERAEPTPAVTTTATAVTSSSAPSVVPPLAVGGGPAALPTAPTVTAPSAACLSRCQGALQGCLAQPVDGGVPGFANLDLCKKAFEACQAACQ
jgi:hypothetical protein